jgi:hypothetical protein
MKGDLEFDENLWFSHKGCDGKHYLIGNPHTFYGRILAWCPKKETSFCVSISEIVNMSDYSKYWIDGFLRGNEPEPPTNSVGDVDFESKEYNKWGEEIELFNRTGYWYSASRNCEICGEEILKSEPDETCKNCKK